MGRGTDPELEGPEEPKGSREPEELREPGEPREPEEPILLDGDDVDGARARIRARASALVRETLRAFPDLKPPPFRPELYTALLGIPVVYSREIEGWDALLVPTRAGYRILCNDRMPPSRRAFSLCHEVGHTFFAGSQAKRHFLRTKRREAYLTGEEARLERACDIVAAELLMPQPWFDEAVGRHGFRAGALPALSRDFAVSLEAAALRLVETASRPCAVGFFEFAPRPSTAGGRGRGRGRGRCTGTGPGTGPGDPTTQAYRARRVFRSAGFPLLWPEGKSVPSSSIIHRASLQRDELARDETFSLGRTRARVSVSAFPLHRGEGITEPPTVCGVFSEPASG